MRAEHDETTGASCCPRGVAADTIYVVGGLLGNAAALDAVEAMAGAEIGRVELVFAGDVHLLDAEPGAFARLDLRLDGYPAIRAGIEERILRTASPRPRALAQIAADALEALDARLAAASSAEPQAVERLSRLPETLPGLVGGVTVAIGAAGAAPPAAMVTVHPFSREARMIPAHDGTLEVFGGAAGVGNFWGDPRGVVTRISVRRSPHASVYGMRAGALHVDALYVPYDREAALAAVDAAVSADDPAVRALRARIARGGPIAALDAAPRVDLLTAA